MSILADYDTLLKQASMTADDYMNKAMGRINACFGDGYAQANPLLVAAFMKVAASDFNNAVLCQTLESFSGNLLTLYGNSRRRRSISEKIIWRKFLPRL